jgi:hypothetical protein
MTTYIHYDERNHDPPLIEWWDKEQYDAHQRGRAYGFGDAIISGGDIVCLAEMRQHRDYRAAIDKITQRVTVWMAEQQKPKRKRGKR